MAAHARAAHRHDAHLLVRVVAELLAQGAAIGVWARAEPGDVAGEGVVVAYPVADVRQIRAEPAGHDVVWVADEYRTVAHPRVPRDVPDHLGVVVRRDQRLPAAA